jgi:hypothetical protein
VWYQIVVISLALSSPSIWRHLAHEESCIPVQFINFVLVQAIICCSFSVIQGACVEISTDASNFTSLVVIYNKLIWKSLCCHFHRFPKLEVFYIAQNKVQKFHWKTFKKHNMMIMNYTFNSITYVQTLSLGNNKSVFNLVHTVRFESNFMRI